MPHKIISYFQRVFNTHYNWERRLWAGNWTRGLCSWLFLAAAFIIQMQKQQGLYHLRNFEVTAYLQNPRALSHIKISWRNLSLSQFAVKMTNDLRWTDCLLCNLLNADQCKWFLLSRKALSVVHYLESLMLRYENIRLQILATKKFMCSLGSVKTFLLSWSIKQHVTIRPRNLGFFSFHKIYQLFLIRWWKPNVTLGEY